MRSRLLRVATFAAAALLIVSIACKKGDAPPATDSKVTPTPSAASTAASAAAAMDLFKAMNLQTSIQDTAAAMIDSEVSRNPGLTPFRDTMLTWLKKYMTWEAMVPELTKLYTTTFTDDELKQMAKFYASPAGKKSLEKLPELMQRTAMIGAGLAQPHSDELKAAMTAKSEELQKQQAGGPGGPGAMGGAPAPGGQAAPARPRPSNPPAPKP